MTLQVTLEAPTPVAPAWDRLALRLDAAPYHWSGWYAAWWGAFGRGTPRVVVARRDGTVVGVVPIEIDGGHVRAPANAHTPEFVPLAVDLEVLAGLAGAIADLRPRSVHLAHLTLPAGAEAVWLGALGAGLPRQEVVTSHRSPYLDLDRPLQDVVAGLGRSYAKSARRRRRRAEELGAVTVRTVTGADGLGPELDRCFAVEASGWKGAQGSAIACDPAVESFYREVARWAAGRGWLQLDLLEFGDRLAAFELTLRLRGVVHVLKAAYDDELRPLAPGSMLLDATTTAAHRDPGLRRAEWLGADDDYKRAWTDLAHERRIVDAYPDDLGGAVRASVSRSRQQVRGWALERLDAGTLDRLRTVRGRLHRTTPPRGPS